VITPSVLVDENGILGPDSTSSTISAGGWLDLWLLLATTTECSQDDNDIVMHGHRNCFMRCS